MGRRFLILLFIAIVVIGVGAYAFISAQKEQDQYASLFPANHPVNDAQVRQKLQSAGYTNVQIAHQGDFLSVSGSHGGEPAQFMINRKDGKIRDAEDDDD